MVDIMYNTPNIIQHHFPFSCPAFNVKTYPPMNPIRRAIPFLVSKVVPLYILVIVDSHLLNDKALNLVLHLANLSRQLRSIIRSNASSNNRSRNTTSASKSRLGGNVNVSYVLVFAEEGEMEKDGEWARVGC